MENNEQLIITPLADIKKLAEERKAGKAIKLPSGLVFKLRTASLTKLLMDDKLPTSLVSVALKPFNEGTQNKEITKEEVKSNLQAMNFVVTLAVAEPTVVLENPTEDQIHIDDIPEMDRLFIFNYAQNGVNELEKFPTQQ